MAISKRRGKWVLDYYNADHKRVWLTCETRAKAEEADLKVRNEGKQRKGQSTFDSKITVKEYAETKWLPRMKAIIRPRSYVEYEADTRLRIIPQLGHMSLRDLTRDRIIDFLLGLKQSLSPASVKKTQTILAGMLTAARSSNLLQSNPAEKLIKELRLNKEEEAEEIKAFTADQRRSFLDATWTQPSHAMLFQTMAGTGMRLGEALALTMDSIDMQAGKIRVSGTLYRGKKGPTKSGKVRTVDCSKALVSLLEGHRKTWAAQTLKNAWTEKPYAFRGQTGEALQNSPCATVFKKILKAAKLPGHFSPHSLRHSYASILLSQGASLKYVQQQMGHASIKMTADTYGAWLPIDGNGAVDRLDSRPTVTLAASGS